MSAYDLIISHIFETHWQAGLEEFVFNRQEIADAAKSVGEPVPKNLGDVLYSYRSRRELPTKILQTQPRGRVWVIEACGRAKYRFALFRELHAKPNPELVTINIPDATPEIIAAYAQGDEQSLLARLRYNRLIDIFLGITAYSLQNHLRTTVKNMGQIEIDEVYVGINREGTQFVVPVQAKGHDDRIAITQILQDIAFCAETYENLISRVVSAQFMADDVIAMFEFVRTGREISILREHHFRLVSMARIDAGELDRYRTSYVRDPG